MTPENDHLTETAEKRPICSRFLLLRCGRCDSTAAAALHADYLEASPADLEPVWKLLIGLYFWNPQTDPATVIELVEPLFGDNASLFTVESASDGRLLLFWKDDQTIDPLLAYKPLVIEVVALRVPAKRQLSYIWGLPVLGLRDLIEEYQKAAAHTVEYAMRNRLRATARALTAMLMKARG